MSDVIEPWAEAPGRDRAARARAEMRSSFLDYAMSVIVSRALPDVRDGLKPVHRRVLWGMHDAGVQPNRPYKKSASIVGDVMGTLPPARRPGDLRHARPDGAAVLAALPARRRPGQLRLARRRSAGRDALHRMPAHEARDRDAARHRHGHGRLRAELRRVAQGAARDAGAVPEPARQRLLRDRRRDGDEHAAAQPRRGDRRGRAADRQARGERRRPDEAPQRPRLPDRRDHRRPLRDPRRLPHRPRPHRHARPRPHRGAPRRQERDRRHRAALRRQEGRRQRRDQEDRRPRQREGDHRGLGSRRPLRPLRDADPDRAQARRDPAGRAQQALQAHGAAVDVRLQRRRARRRRAARDVAARDRAPLPRLPARGRDPALEVRAAPEREARARPQGLPDRARQPRRRDRPDPRLRRHRLGPHRA